MTLRESRTDRRFGFLAGVIFMVIALALGNPGASFNPKKCWMGICGMQCNATFEYCVETPNPTSWCSTMIVMGCATEPDSNCCQRSFALF